jgi:hypothetical protein
MMEKLNPKFVLSGQDYVFAPINLLVANIQRVYSEFVGTVNRIVYSSFAVGQIEWKYEKDEATGFDVLKTRKRPESLDAAQRLADEIFK